MIDSIAQLLTDFGVTWPKLIGQIITFAILLFALKMILYKPMIKMLDERKAKIATGLKDAEAAAEARSRSEVEAAERLAEATRKAEALLEETTAAAGRLKAELTAQTQEELQRMKLQQEAQIAAAQQEMLQQVRSEVAQLVVATTEKVLDQKLSDKDKQDLAAKAAKELK